MKLKAICLTFVAFLFLASPVFAGAQAAPLFQFDEKREKLSLNVGARENASTHLSCLDAIKTSEITRLIREFANELGSPACLSKNVELSAVLVEIKRIVPSFKELYIFSDLGNLEVPNTTRLWPSFNKAGIKLRFEDLTYGE